MNTNTHIVLGLALLGRKPEARLLTAIVIGAVLPDLAMFGFYLYHRLILNTPEMTIWGVEYFKPAWQNLFDLFNSIPLIIIGAVIAWRMKWQALLYCFLAMLIHVLMDLPVHNDDAHRHFYPFINWKFISPVSYWDSDHYGRYFAIVECVLALAALTWMFFKRYRSWWIKSLLLLLGLSYAMFFAYAAVVWIG